MDKKEKFNGFEDEQGQCPGCDAIMDHDEGVYFCDACDMAFIWWGSFYDCVGDFDCIDRQVVRSFLSK